MPDYTSLDDEATQCSWHTLCLHAEYRVYTSHVTDVVWPLNSFLSFFILSTWCVNYNKTTDCPEIVVNELLMLILFRF